MRCQRASSSNELSAPHRTARYLPASGRGVSPPLQPLHVAPAAHSSDLPPPHWILHAVVPPHLTVHAVLPAQSAVHPPFGQSIVHVLFPVHATVDPVSTVTVQVLPPPQVTVLFVPVSSVHVLVPLHVDVQFASQLPLQFD